MAATLVGLALSAVMAGGVHAAPPRRIVSLNPCLDAILLDVADPGQIAALSHYSREPSQSAVWARARRFAFTWGTAEEVIALKPDLVVSGGLDDAALNDLLPRLRARQAHFDVPDTVADSLAQVRRMAMLVGHPERGEAVVARIEAALTEAQPHPGQPRLGALIYEHHGLASGPHTLVDELMRWTGFDNLASSYGLTLTGEVPLESLVAHPPQVLLAGRRAPGEPVWADRILSHPVLRTLAPRMRRETFPEPLMFCGGPTLVPAVQALARARDDALAGVSR